MHFPYLRPAQGRSALSVSAACAALLALQACGGSDGEPPIASLSPADACAALQKTTVPMADIALPTSGARVTGTTLVAPAGTGALAVGEYCQVRGEIDPVDRTAPPIRFDLALPSAWNRKAIQLMGGGYDGVLIAGSGNIPGATGYATPVARGYAGFGSDSGHQGSPGEASFGMNREALENYLGDQLRKTRDVAVALMKLRYGSAPVRTYSAGGSGGGREALYVADRWPALYDGVVAYYPATSLTAMLTNYTAISKKLAAPGAWSTPAKALLLRDAVTAACDAGDGVRDGVVGNVAACGFDPATLRCPGGGDSGDACLSDAQIAGYRAYDTALELPYSLAFGINRYGRFNIFQGGLIASDGTAAPAHPSTTAMPFATYIGESFARYFVHTDAAFNALLFDYTGSDAVRQRLQYLSARMDINPDMSAFAAKGGKAIIVHGLADPLIPASSSDLFHARASAAMGPAAVRSFLRYYTVPGYAHGAGGTFTVSYDALTALDAWVDGTAPAAQTVRDLNTATAGRSRPLCEYPTWPRYNGSGDVNLAASFTCVP
jgi:feruloyl esterase